MVNPSCVCMKIKPDSPNFSNHRSVEKYRKNSWSSTDQHLIRKSYKRNKCICPRKHNSRHPKKRRYMEYLMEYCSNYVEWAPVPCIPAKINTGNHVKSSSINFCEIERQDCDRVEESKKLDWKESIDTVTYYDENGERAVGHEQDNISETDFHGTNKKLAGGEKLVNTTSHSSTEVDKNVSPERPTNSSHYAKPQGENIYGGYEEYVLVPSISRSNSSHYARPQGKNVYGDYEEYALVSSIPGTTLANTTCLLSTKVNKKVSPERLTTSSHYAKPKGVNIYGGYEEYVVVPSIPEATVTGFPYMPPVDYLPIISSAVLREYNDEVKETETSARRNHVDTVENIENMEILVGNELTNLTEKVLDKTNEKKQDDGEHEVDITANLSTGPGGNVSFYKQTNSSHYVELHQDKIYDDCYEEYFLVPWAPGGIDTEIPRQNDDKLAGAIRRKNHIETVANIENFEIALGHEQMSEILLVRTNEKSGIVANLLNTSDYSSTEVGKIVSPKKPTYMPHEGFLPVIHCGVLEQNDDRAEDAETFGRTNLTETIARIENMELVAGDEQQIISGKVLYETNENNKDDAESLVTTFHLTTKADEIIPLQRSY